MPYARIDEGIDLYYELSGPEDGPVVLQFGGGLFGRHNFGFVNDGFRENGFRLLSYDARGYGASSSPREWYTIEGWADDGAKLLDALGFERVLVHGTSMGGYDRHRLHGDPGERGRSRRAPMSRLRSRTSTVARSSGSGVAWPSRCRGTTSPITSRRRPSAPGFSRAEQGANTFELVRSVIGVNDPYTVRQACIAMEEMNLTPLVPQIDPAAADDEWHVRHPLSARAGAPPGLVPGRWLL